MGCVDNCGVGQLPGSAPAWDRMSVQVADHGRAMDAVTPSERVDRRSARVAVNELVDIVVGESSLCGV
jgi:hypothetical protein